jgi:hypothetical protein
MSPVLYLNIHQLKLFDKTFLTINYLMYDDDDDEYG